MGDDTFSYSPLDSFTSLDDLPRKVHGNTALVREIILRRGKFSSFDADLSPQMARTLTAICRDPTLEIDNSIGFPWTKVRRKP